MGTFNVNDKMPTQDLSSWVRVGLSNATEKVIPPLKKISPLSLGDFEKEYFAPSSAQLLRGESTRAAEEVQDPDILVLGFQELDLSTEALLYSTKTLREEAWTSAIFAGLGEKAEIYEKVGIIR